LIRHIYALADPRTGEVRYVGVANDANVRLVRHVKGRNGSTHCARWIKQLVDESLLPEVTVLETCEGDEWIEAERRWIADYRKEGARLTNHADGGQGASGYRFTDEQKQKVKEGLHRKIADDPEWWDETIRRRNEAAVKRRAELIAEGKLDPTTGGRALRGKPKPPGHGARVAAALKGVPKSEAHKKALREAWKRRKAKDSEEVKSSA